MVAWGDAVAAEPEFTATVHEVFAANRHKVLATLRADGSPRLTGIETEFGDGQLKLGMMFGSRKAQDLRRDPRFALHNSSTQPDESDPEAWPGDVRISGRVVEILDDEQIQRDAPTPTGQAHLFHADIDEIVLTRVRDNRLTIDIWRPGQGLQRFTRD